MWFTQVSIRNPIFAVMVMLALVVLGTLGYQRMAVDQFPEVTVPVIIVTTDYNGAAPTSVKAMCRARLRKRSTRSAALKI